MNKEIRARWYKRNKKRLRKIESTELFKAKRNLVNLLKDKSEAIKQLDPRMLLTIQHTIKLLQKEIDRFNSFMKLEEYKSEIAKLEESLN